MARDGDGAGDGGGGVFYIAANQKYMKGCSTSWAASKGFVRHRLLTILVDKLTFAPLIPCAEGHYTTTKVNT